MCCVRALLTPKMLHGLSLILAPKGYGAVIYAMEFPWDADGAPKTGIGSTTMRTMMRIINHIPAAKNAMARSERADRGRGRQD